MMSLTFGLFTQVSGSGPLGPLVLLYIFFFFFFMVWFEGDMSVVRGWAAGKTAR